MIATCILRLCSCVLFPCYSRQCLRWK
uniref:Uncharacterized protein n=1 Tax=Arundo donax TaxID=35708 RepID=A0A0A9AJF3_ARUDO